MKFETDSVSGLAGKFVKLDDKQKIQGVFRGDPKSFRKHWVNNRTQECPGVGCVLCKDGEKSSFRFRINFVTKDEAGAFQAKVFEGGWKMYQALKALHEGDYNLEKTVVVITRNGKGTDTTYTILPAKQHEITPETEKLLSQVQLVALDPSGDGMTNESDFAPASDNIPF
jgi:hypothetical protein